MIDFIRKLFGLQTRAEQQEVERRIEEARRKRFEEARASLNVIAHTVASTKVSKEKAATSRRKSRQTYGKSAGVNQPAVDNSSDLLNPLNPISPLNPIYSSGDSHYSRSSDTCDTPRHSYDSSPSYSYSSSDSSSYDSGSSSSDSGCSSD